MKIFKKVLTIIIMCFVFLPINVFAESNQRLENFVKNTAENGYINATISIEERPNEKFNVDFLYKENISEMDIGFYTASGVTDTLVELGIPYDVSIDGDYLTISAAYSTSNIQDELKRLSVFPFIKVDGYVNEDNLEFLFTGNFNDTLFKEQRESNTFVNDIISTNCYSFRFKPSVDRSFVSSTESKDSEGYYIWKYNATTKDTIVGVAKPFPQKYVIIGSIFWIIVGLLLCAIIIFVAIKIIKKIKNKKYANNNYYNDNNYNNY